MASKKSTKKEKFEQGVEQWTERFEEKVEQKTESFEKGVEDFTERFEKGVEQKTERFERFVEASNDGFRKSMVTWLRTSQFFDGMVNTPARILINVMSILALYVWTIDVANKERNLVAWVITLIVLLFMQAASVRFVFSTGGVADEFQEKRINLAYRRAYKTIRKIALIPVGVFAFLVIAGPHGEANLLWDFVAYRLDNYRSLTLAIFLVAVASFQKYFSYGWIGEPMVIREKGAIRER